MDGFLLIDKPPGMTSHDVVATVRRRWRVRKAGHAGTLDPLATGLLIVGVGSSTRSLRMLARLPKTYEAEITLGATSETDDAEGTIRTPDDRQQTAEPTVSDVERALKEFVGTMEQVPPAYSAVKVRGVPAYRRARRGERVTLQPRQVTVYEADVLAYRYPLLHVCWTVSAGTYVRALARDLGQALGTGAYLSALRRTAIGHFLVTEAHALSSITPAALVPRETFLRRLPETNMLGTKY